MPTGEALRRLSATPDIERLPVLSRVLILGCLLAHATHLTSERWSGLDEAAVIAANWPKVIITPVDSDFSIVGEGSSAALTIVVSIRNDGPEPVRMIHPCHLSSLAALEQLVAGTTDEWDTVYVPVRTMRLDRPCEIAPGATHIDSATIRLTADSAFRLPIEHAPGKYRAVYWLFSSHAGPVDASTTGEGRALPEAQRRSSSFLIRR